MQALHFCGGVIKSHAVVGGEKCLFPHVMAVPGCPGSTSIRMVWERLLCMCTGLGFGHGDVKFGALKKGLCA